MDFIRIARIALRFSSFATFWQALGLQLRLDQCLAAAWMASSPHNSILEPRALKTLAQRIVLGTELRNLASVSSIFIDVHRFSKAFRRDLGITPSMLSTSTSMPSMTFSKPETCLSPWPHETGHEHL